MTPILRNLAIVAVTLLVACAGVAIAKFASLPLPWMLGPLLATGAFSLSGLKILGEPLNIPKRSRNFFIPVLGVMIASRITPEVVEGMSQWWPSLIAVVFYVDSVIFLSQTTLNSRGYFAVIFYY